MNNIIKVLINGAVIFLITAPFLFVGKLCSQSYPELCLKNQSNSIFQSSKVWIPAFAGMTLSDKTVSFTSFSRRTDTLKTDSNMTVVKQKEATQKKFKMKKSPGTAVLLSAILPGAGQFYNESYWKVPIVVGLVGYFGYEYFRNNNLFKDYKSQYEASQTPENPAGDLQLKTLREFYRDQRNDFVWYFVIVYVVNLVDAYIDAHLFDFDVSDDKFTKTGTPGREYRLKMNLKF